jgi:hypothetical protein
MRLLHVQKWKAHKRPDVHAWPRHLNQPRIYKELYSGTLE